MAKHKSPIAPDGLSIRERQILAFINEYIGNGQKARPAAVFAGVSKKRAMAWATKTLADDDVRIEIDRRIDEISKRSALTAQEVIASLARAMRFDPGLMYNKDGSLKSVHEMPDDVRLELEGADVDEVTKRMGRGEKSATITIRTSKVRYAKKSAARDQAMRHFGLYAKDNPNVVPPDEAAAKLRQQLAAMEDTTTGRSSDWKDLNKHMKKER